MPSSSKVPMPLLLVELVAVGADEVAVVVSDKEQAAFGRTERW